MWRQWRVYLLALAGLLARPAVSQDIGPLVEISRPNAVGSCNTGFTPFVGLTWSTDHALEPFVAANPINPRNVAAAWYQGLFQDMIAGVSFDGGPNWQRVLMPLTICSGGPYLATGDPWLSFTPNGDLYAVGITWNSNSWSDRQIVVSKSADGGLHWSAPVVIPGSHTVDPPADHPSITADPTDPQFVYAIWNGSNSPHSSAAVFTRTTDGGLTWETARAIVQTASQSYIQFSQILVLPNGTLVDIFEFYEQQPNKPITFTNLQLLRSTDHGQTWSSPINAVTMTPLYRPNGYTLVVDPKTGQFVFDLTNPSFALDSRNGNVYAVWEDGRFSNFQYNDIAFSMSADGGTTWSAPIRVNQTPLSIPPPNRQAFFPNVAVAADGTIGVSYYDFRFNDTNPGLPTDRWLVSCSPSSTSASSDPACWGSEVRLTDSSFNMEAIVPRVPNGDIYLGDYFGLAAASDDFVATFVAVDSQNITSIFARRVGP
jgi:BNR repeat protein